MTLYLTTGSNRSSEAAVAAYADRLVAAAYSASGGDHAATEGIRAGILAAYTATARRDPTAPPRHRAGPPPGRTAPRPAIAPPSWFAAGRDATASGPPGSGAPATEGPGAWIRTP